MRALIVMAAGLGLAGCAPNLPPPGSAAQRARCDYEASAATAGIPMGFRSGWMRADVRDACLRAVAEENYEAGRKPSGAVVPHDPHAEPLPRKAR